MKALLIPALSVAAALHCMADFAPGALPGKAILMNYTQASYDGVPYSRAVKNAGLRSLFAPKATRNLVPLTPSGTYAYTKTGSNTAQIEAPFYGNGEGSRIYTLHFTSPYGGYATEELVGITGYRASGSAIQVTGSVTGITFTVK